jgi:hypothetical protein
VVGLPALGAVAAVEQHGVPLERLVLVPHPGPDWPTVVAALLDGLDMVVVAAPPATSTPGCCVCSTREPAAAARCWWRPGRGSAAI